MKLAIISSAVSTQFECSHKVSQIGYCFMKLAIISSDHLQDLIPTELD
jgi:hypothetical protein